MCECMWVWVWGVSVGARGCLSSSHVSFCSQPLSLLPGGNFGPRQASFIPVAGSSIPPPGWQMCCVLFVQGCLIENEVQLPSGWIKARCTHAVLSDLLSKATRPPPLVQVDRGPASTSPSQPCPVDKPLLGQEWPLPSPPSQTYVSKAHTSRFPSEPASRTVTSSTVKSGAEGGLLAPAPPAGRMQWQCLLQEGPGRVVPPPHSRQLK